MKTIRKSNDEKETTPDQLSNTGQFILISIYVLSTFIVFLTMYLH